MIDQNRSLERMMPGVAEAAMPLLWAGEALDPEMGVCLAWAQQQASLTTVAGVSEACDQVGPAEPAVVLLPMPWSGAVCARDLIRLSRRWPLATIVVLAGSCVDGLRRRGPAIAGGITIPWYELPGRLRLWRLQRASGVAAALAAPLTSRREDRLLARIAVHRAFRQPVIRVTVAANRREALESLEILAAVAGMHVVSRHLGIPVTETAGNVLLWDAESVDDAVLTQLGRLRRERPDRPMLLFESFPRGATALAVREAGGSHVLGRPVEADVVAETVRWCLQHHAG
jgi:ActR/RegA family two-component response regulator